MGGQKLSQPKQNNYKRHTLLCPSVYLSIYLSKHTHSEKMDSDDLGQAATFLVSQVATKHRVEQTGTETHSLSVCVCQYVQKT